ncbi:uncharacterized protein crm [Epargyreus clarus]|uniref:uncharacterized protein crm n=1 Tax=Epargyreus clarus TaxID=520877 RepID=UPI003C2FA72C
MPNKEVRQTSETKSLSSTQHGTSNKTVNVVPKATMSKVVVKELAMSPGAPPAAGAEENRPELLGSLTTLQQQRTSARVIKKLRLEPPVDKRDVAECETPIKIDDKDLKFPTVKQRMPKALWSADEKSLFFEALNEYGKDFDAITAHICAKMKKKGMVPEGNLKTKTQVSHFYYRTWHKLSKHVHFDENVKKVAQELYALINYGELRRKLVSVNEKTCARLDEMVRCGSMAVRARGRTLRVRTPMCRALRRLNQITGERGCGARVCGRAAVVLRARDAAAWARVQAAAHNPRAALAIPPRTTLCALIRALARRWERGQRPGRTNYNKSLSMENELETKPSDEQKDLEHTEQTHQNGNVDEYENHLGLEPDRTLLQGKTLHRIILFKTNCGGLITKPPCYIFSIYLDYHPKKLALHVGPRPGAEVHLPVLSPSEQLSSQKICFSSYLERMGSKREDNDGSGVKIRTPKRQRKDSVNDKDKDLEPKKIKTEDSEPKLMNIDETAIDGIELMAHFKSNIEDAEAEETAEEEVEREPERDKDMSEKEKDSFSELEDDEKYNKSDTDNESDSKGDKTAKQPKFKNLKVKFRIRPKKRGGSIYTLVLGKEEDKPEEKEPEVEAKPDIDVHTAVRQIRKGWSEVDAGDLTIGDLYLMFGARSKLELDYWWAEPTPPLPRPVQKAPKPTEPEKVADSDKAIDKREKVDKTPDKGVDSSVEDEKEKRESDTDMIFSPKNTFSQDSNDGMSGDERKSEQLASPDHKSSGTLKLVSKLINRPVAQPPPNGFSLLSDRLKRLLALAGNTHVTGAQPGRAAPAPPRCACGHVCPPRRAPPYTHTAPAPPRCACGHVCPPRRAPPRPHQQQKQPMPAATLFRHPAPIAPRHDPEAFQSGAELSLEMLPRRRRGRPRLADRRVVVQRLLPLLPKLPPPNDIIPVKMVSNTPPALPRILPKPPPTSTSDLSFFYVLSESNGQFYFHDGDRRIPISPLDNAESGDNAEQDDLREEEDYDIKDVKMDISPTEVCYRNKEKKQDSEPVNPKTEQSGDMSSFLPSESLSMSLSLSPSRLLRDAEGWLDGAAHDFSLSSFLHTLDARAPRHDRNDPPDHAMDSQLQSLMAESSVDYVAKFADLAAEVTDEADPLAE